MSDIEIEDADLCIARILGPGPQGCLPRPEGHTDDEPNSPAIPRPGNRPYYIAPDCPDCGTPLVLSDYLHNPQTPADDVWYDEWECPRCQEGIWMDWPAAEWDTDDTDPTVADEDLIL